MIPPWTVRPASDDDVDELVALHRCVFGSAITRERWLWKLRARPGVAANVWVAEADGRIVFQYAGIPIRVRHRATETCAMVSVDTMTHPAFRRRGLLTEVGGATYAHWRQAGVSFVVGLPNENWGSRTRTLGWSRVAELRRWVRHLDPIRALTGAFGLGAKSRSVEGSTDEISTPNSAPAKSDPRGEPELLPVRDFSHLDDLWARACDEGVVRDASWFRWRYLDAPDRWEVLGAWDSGRLVGAVTFRVGEARGGRRSGIVGEIVAVRPAIRRLLVSRACERLRRAGATRAALLVQPGSGLEVAALAAGFLPSRWSFSVEAVDLGGGIPDTALFQASDFDVV